MSNNLALAPEKDAVNNWQSANYHYLLQKIEALELCIAKRHVKNLDPEPALVETENKKEVFNFDRLCTQFNLSLFEQELLTLALGFELSFGFRKTCAEILGHEPACLNLTLALILLNQVDWQTFSPQSPLRYWYLLELSEGRTWLSCPLRITESVFYYLMGTYARDERLACIVTPLIRNSRQAIIAPALVEKLVQHWSCYNRPVSVIRIQGNDFDDQCNLVSEACSQLQYPVFNLDLYAFPNEGNEFNQLLRLLVCNTILYPDSIYIIEYDLLPTDKRRQLETIIQYIPSNCVLLGQETLPRINHPMVSFHVPALTAQEQLAVWQQVLPENAFSIEQLAAITAQFNLSTTQIQRFAQALALNTDNISPESNSQYLWQYCRQNLRQKVQSLAQVILPKAKWQDLSLPQQQIQIINHLIAQIKQRNQVYQHWGFANKTNRGLGICALFAGPSGTGKTLAAEVIAQELQLDIYHIDLSTVVSKYIGETEQHLKKIFDAAEVSGAILLFDEADALFGKRSEVQDSHDRYANLGVSYLLQRIEAYSGLSILTTNLKSALDEAFLRRIRFIVQFPFPDHAQRMRIWQTILFCIKSNP